MAGGAPPSGGAAASSSTPPGVAPAAAVGAGSYTQMMQAPKAPAPSLLGSNPGVPPKAAAKKGTPTWVFIAAGVIVFLLVVAILILVLKK